jgi:hypothetical protein
MEKQMPLEIQWANGEPRLGLRQAETGVTILPVPTIPITSLP